MVYSVAWDEASPPGASTNANTIDTEFQELKESIRERMNDILDPTTPWEDDLADPKLIDQSSTVDIASLTGTPRVALVYKDSSQTIVNNVALIVVFDSEHFDTANFHDNAVDNTRLTVSEDGWYRIYMSLLINSSGDGDQLFYKLFKNGQPLHEHQKSFEPPPGFELSQIDFNIVDQAVVDDYYEIELKQNSAGNWSILQDTDLGYFGIEQLNGAT
jgi:hypothetical protein